MTGSIYTWLAVISPLRRRCATASTALTGCRNELEIVVGILVVVVEATWQSAPRLECYRLAGSPSAVGPSSGNNPLQKVRTP